MRAIRRQLTEKLNSIDELVVYPFIAEDEIMHKGKTYFFYSVEDTLVDMDGTRKITVTGFVSRLFDNTDYIDNVDIFAEEIVKKFKELNFTTNIADVTYNKVAKLMLTSVAYYNEVNYGLI